MSDVSISSSRMSLSASNSFFCFSESGFPRISSSRNRFSIEFPFVACGAAGGNDPHYRFGLFLGVGVDDGKKQERASHRPDRVPPFLTVLNALDKQQAIQIGRASCRGRV